MSIDIKFLGTGAADGMNGAFPDNFDNKDLRRCASTLLNGKILLDCGPHALSSLSIAGIDPQNVTDIILTHLHSDHFCLEAVNAIAAKNPALRLWCRKDAVFVTKPNCEIVKMATFCEYQVGGFSVTGVPANHAEYPQHLSIEKDGKKLFYGLDGAWFLGETVEYMKNRKYDIFVFDTTVGDYTGDYRMGEHNSIPMIRLMAESMKTLSIIGDTSQLVLSHLAMCLHKPYAETCNQVNPDGFTVAYDGLSLSI